MEYKEDRRKFFGNLGKGLVGIIGAGIVGGCGEREHNEYIGFESHPVDQVFRDHDGFRLIYTDEEGILRENRYSSILLNPDYRREVHLENIPDEVRKKFRYNASLGLEEGYREYCHPTCIIKDLKEGERGFANTIRYKFIRARDYDLEKSYTEVHLPKNQNISPGNEVFGGKFRVKAEMHEVK